MGVAITEPIINYSTYTDEDSTGKQMIYLYQDFIGDTLRITGYIPDYLSKDLEFIVY